MKILTLDGGGSKGIYSLGILHEIEAILGSPLINHFDCFYGVSTGSIIASGLALGRSVEDLRKLYMNNIPDVMSPWTAKKRSNVLKKLLQSEFEDKTFEDFSKYVGIVTSCVGERIPKIFKSNIEQAHGRKNSFKPGFGAKIWEAVYASCSAVPFFNVHGFDCEDNHLELIDGGFSANNPTLFALIDALKTHKCKLDDIIIINIGTGQFPLRYSLNFLCSSYLFFPVKDLVPTFMEINSNTLAIFSKMLFENTKILRLNEVFSEPHLKTNFLENNTKKLQLLYQRGKSTFGNQEESFKKIWNRSPN